MTADPGRASPRLVSGSRDTLASIGQKIRVVFTDLDGTLLGQDGNLFDDGNGHPTSDAGHAIAELAASEIELVLISGRRAEHVAPLASVLGASGYVAEMGTLVVVDAESGRHDHNKVIRPLGQYPFPDETPYDAMLRTGVIEMLLARNATVELHAPWHDERETSHLLRGALDIDSENDALQAAGHGWCEIVDNGIIPHAYPGLDISIVRAYHVVPKGAGKGTGVRTWLEARGLESFDAAALGDGHADLAMARESAAFFLMRNGFDADPTLAAPAADMANVFVTDGVFTGGWRGAIEALIRDRRPA